LFKEGKSCIPQGSHRKFLVNETHEGDLMGHFEVNKTLNMQKKIFSSSILDVMSKDIIIDALHAYSLNIG